MSKELYNNFECEFDRRLESILSRTNMSDEDLRTILNINQDIRRKSNNNKKYNDNLDLSKYTKHSKSRDVYLIKYKQSPSFNTLTSHWGIVVDNKLYHLTDITLFFYKGRFEVKNFNPYNDFIINKSKIGKTKITDEDFKKIGDSLINVYSSHNILLSNCQNQILIG